MPCFVTAFGVMELLKLAAKLIKQVDNIVKIRGDRRNRIVQNPNCMKKERTSDISPITIILSKQRCVKPENSLLTSARAKTESFSD